MICLFPQTNIRFLRNVFAQYSIFWKEELQFFEIQTMIPRISSLGPAPIKWATIRACIQPNLKARKSFKYSLHKLATGWIFRGSKPSRGEIFRTRPERSCALPSFLYNGYRLKRPGCGAEQLPPSTAKVKERVELYLYFPSGSSWPFTG